MIAAPTQADKQKRIKTKLVDCIIHFVVK